MLEFLKKEAKPKMTYTENGAATYATSGSFCLDFFSCAGAIRYESEKAIISRFSKAYIEDPDLAVKLLFFTRDIRGGLGERRVFRILVRWLCKNRPESIRKNIRYFSEFGRYDDLLCLLGTPLEEAAVEEIGSVLAADIRAMEKDEPVSLLGKWLPSVNASSSRTVKQAKILIRLLGMTDASYRKTLSALRRRVRIIENSLREKDYTFDYGSQPSRALFKYRAAFRRNDEERYVAFLESVSRGEKTMHTKNVAPYELVMPYLQNTLRVQDAFAMSRGEEQVLNTTWEALPDYVGSGRSLAVIDTSGSMYMSRTGIAPAAVALSLGLYFAERIDGEFRDHFISFSEHPQLIRIKGRTFVDRLRYVISKQEVANTNIEAVFDLILRTAVKHHLPKSEMPDRIFILSDMEFDMCAKGSGLTNFESAKRSFAGYGYALPQIVFWNVASRNTQVPVKMNEQGVILLSGVTPMLFSMATKGDIDPYAFMMSVIGNERYEQICA